MRIVILSASEIGMGLFLAFLTGLLLGAVIIGAIIAGAVITGSASSSDF